MGMSGKRFVILTGEKVGQDEWEAVLVKPWEFNGEFGVNGNNVGYHKLILKVIPNPDFEADSFLY